MMRINKAVAPMASETDQPSNAETPIGFRASETGVFEISTDGTETWLCSPLRATSRFRDAVGTGWGRVVEVTDSDGTIHREAILDADIVSAWGRVVDFH